MCSILSAFNLHLFIQFLSLQPSTEVIFRWNWSWIRKFVWFARTSTKHLQPNISVNDNEMSPKVGRFVFERFTVFLNSPSEKAKWRMESHKSPPYDVNFPANRLRKCWIPSMVHVYDFFLGVSSFQIAVEEGDMGMKRTTLEGNMFCACVTGICWVSWKQSRQRERNV